MLDIYQYTPNNKSKQKKRKNQNFPESIYHEIKYSEHVLISFNQMRMLHELIWSVVEVYSVHLFGCGDISNIQFADMWAEVCTPSA